MSQTPEEKQLYALVPKFIEMCLTYRAKAPCNLTVEVDIDTAYAMPGTAVLEVWKTGSDRGVTILHHPDVDGDAAPARVYMLGTYGGGSGDTPGSLRLALVAAVDDVEAKLADALADALFDVADAAKRMDAHASPLPATTTGRASVAKAPGAQ